MAIFDAHCDVLYRMHHDKNLSFDQNNGLHITYDYLKKAGSKVQCFALFIPDKVPQEIKFKTALDMIDILYKDILSKHSDVHLIRSKEDIDALGDDEIGIMLTLEGCDAIDIDLMKLRTLFYLGVRSVGMTWNNPNAAADGLLESRQAGLSDFGRLVVRENNKYKVWTDVSHITEKGFWDCMEEADFPIASHSNVKALCNHPRNLTDEQMKALFKKGGVMGINFLPTFLNESKKASIADILKHIEYICALGGEKHVGFGSDFDGIETTPKELNNVGDFPILINELLKHYSEEIVRGICFENFYRALPL
ncbi:MAG: dipeptidase [Tuberibacillus sp.]